MRPEYELNNKFAETDYGIILDNEIRFSTFKPEFISNEEWVEMLGPDVNNRLHMERAYLLTRWFCAQQPDLTESEKDRLCLTAMVHDWAEAIDGDVPDPLKSDDTMRQEMQSFVKVASSVTEPHDLASRVFPVMFAKTSRLGKMWRAIEVMGYLETGVRASREAAYSDVWAEKFGLNDYQADLLLGHLRHMGAEVCARAVEQLQPVRTLYPAVEVFLGSR